MDMSENTETRGNSGRNVNLDALRLSILSAMKRAEGAGLDTLISFRDIGANLAEAKEALAGTGKGAFGKWCDEHFPFSKEWRARLMKLAAEWEYVREAMKWATSTGRILGRKEYSVDGALALADEWIKTIASYHDDELGDILTAYPALGERITAIREKATKRAAEGGDGEGGEGSGSGSKRKKADGEAEELRKALAEALERVAALEAENAKLRGSKGTKAKPEGEQPKGNVDATTKARAKKVYELAVKGATAGERGAARGRIEEMAVKAGLDTLAFLAACGLDTAAYEKAAADDAEASKEAA